MTDGLYLGPPDNASIICVDEKSQWQVLERIQPMLPMGVNHDYKRRGTTTRSAAERAHPRRSGHLQGAAPPSGVSVFSTGDRMGCARRIDVRCIANTNNDATENHHNIKARLAAHPRWHMHFIPIYSPWLNRLERLIGMITDKAIRSGSFPSVKQLVRRIGHFVAVYNTNCWPIK